MIIPLVSSLWARGKQPIGQVVRHLPSVLLKVENRTVAAWRAIGSGTSLPPPTYVVKLDA